MAKKTKAGNSKEKALEAQLARALADYDNLKKRSERERLTLVKFASSNLIISLLPVLDNLESSQNHLQDQGLQMVIENFKSVLQDEGVIEIKSPIGGDFNAEIHEAVESIESKKDLSGKIAKVQLKGWRYQDGPVLRPAKVEVYK